LIFELFQLIGMYNTQDKCVKW